MKPHLLLILVLVALSGCATRQAHDSVRLPAPLPAELQQYYSYEPISAPPQIQEVEDQPRYVVRRVQLILPATEAKPDPITILWFAPHRAQPAPLILISPISGSNTMFTEPFARLFATHGFHAAIVSRPKKKRETALSVDQFERYLRSAVIRNRQALDWLLAQPTVDSCRVGTFGISYGGIVNAATAGVEPRARYHIFALAGAPLPNVLRESEEAGIRRDWQRLHENTGLTDREIFRQLRGSIRTDPAKLAPYVSSPDVLMVIAWFDRSIGRDNALKLWRALDRPECVFLPFGHYSTILTLPYLEYKAMQFFQTKFGTPPASGNRGYIFTNGDVITTKRETEVPSAPSR